MELSGGPLYQQIVEQLTARIESGSYRAGDKLPSERALCHEYGVSQITVRRALRDLAHAGRVYSRHGLGWYVGRVATEARPEVAIVVTGQDALLDGLLPVCMAALGRAGIRAQALYCGDGEAGAQGMQSLLDGLAPRAVLWGVAGPEQELASRYRALSEESGLPSLLLPRLVEGLDLPAVVLDEGEGVSQITAHLLDQGHRRIAYIGGDPALAEGWRRYWGFATTVWQRGLDLPLDWILAVPQGQSIELDRVEALWGAPPWPTAVACASDALAAELMQRLPGLGLSCPTQVAVASLGDEPLAAYLSPPLTAFRLDARAWAHAVAQAARALLEGRRPETQVISGRLVIRASCGARPSAA